MRMRKARSLPPSYIPSSFLHPFLHVRVLSPSLLTCHASRSASVAPKPPRRPNPQVGEGPLTCFQHRAAWGFPHRPH